MTQRDPYFVQSSLLHLITAFTFVNSSGISMDEKNRISATEDAGRFEQGSLDDRGYEQPRTFSHTVQLGLIVAEKHFDVVCVLSEIKNTLKRIENILSDTPHLYNFILPYEPGPEHVILESLLSDQIWENLSLPQVQLLRLDDESRDLCPFEGEIAYDITTVMREDSTPGSDPVYDAVIEWSNLVLLVGEWEPGSDQYRPGSIFEMARLHGRTIIAINPVIEDEYEIPHDDRIFESYKQLNEYNMEKIPDGLFRYTILRYKNTLRDECKRSGLPEDVIAPAYSTLLPHFTRAKILTKKYRRMYAWTGTVISFLAALAVLTITVQTLFFPQWPFLVWIEVIEILTIIMLMITSRIGDIHRKWIDYNFLAERIRASFFFCIVCVTCEKPDTPPHMTLSNRPNDWMVMAFSSIMDEMPLSYCRLDIPFRPLKRFFRSAWITERLRHFENAAEIARKRFVLLAYTGEALFGLTLVLAVLHALGIAHWELYFNITLPLLLACLTITLPAFGAAVGAIRVQREYMRNSERYSHLVRHLTSLNNSLRHAENLSDLCELLDEMNEIMLREQQDWRIIFRFRKIEAI